MKKIFLIILLLSFSLSAQEKNYLTTRSFNRGSTLYKNLIAFWKFDGTWEDSWGNNDLNPFGGAYVSATGKSGQAASFEVDSTQSAYITDNADLSFINTDPLTISCWVKFERLDIVGAFVVAKAPSALLGEYALFAQNTGTIRAGFGNTNQGFGTATTSTINTGTWYFVAMWYNPSADSVYIQVNNGTPVRGAAPYNLIDGNSSFYVGGGDDGNYGDLLIDDLGVWGRSGNAITGKAFVDSIYSSGNGWRP